MEEEFNLSEKEFGLNELPVYYRKDVKEFIKRLKAHFVDYEEGVNYWIDKLAGDKLI